MSFYLPPLNVNTTFNLSDYNYQYENINYITVAPVAPVINFPFKSEIFEYR